MDISSPAERGRGGRRSRRIIAAALVAAEAAVLLVVTVLGFIDAAVRDSGSGGIAVAVICLLATAWLGWTSLALLRRRSWARGSALTAQLLLAAVALGTFQGLLARPDLGVVMLVVAAVVLVLLFTADLNDPSPRTAEED